MKALLSFLLLFVFILLFEGSASRLCKEYQEISLFDTNIGLFRELFLYPDQALHFTHHKARVCYDRNSQHQIVLGILVYKDIYEEMYIHGAFNHNAFYIIKHPVLKPEYSERLDTYAELLADFLYSLATLRFLDHSGSAHAHLPTTLHVQKNEEVNSDLYSLYHRFSFVETDRNDPMSPLQLLSKAGTINGRNAENNAYINSQIKRMLGKSDSSKNYLEEDGIDCILMRTEEMVGFLTYHEVKDELKTKEENGKMVFVVDRVVVAPGRENEPILLQMLQHLLYTLDIRRNGAGLVIKILIERKSEKKYPNITDVFKICGFPRNPSIGLVKKREIAKTSRRPETHKKDIRKGGADVEDEHTSYLYTPREFEAGDPVLGGNYCNY